MPVRHLRDGKINKNCILIYLKRLFINARNLKSDEFYIDGLICTRTSLTRAATAAMRIITDVNRPISAEGINPH